MKTNLFKRFKSSIEPLLSVTAPLYSQLDQSKSDQRLNHKILKKKIRFSTGLSVLVTLLFLIMSVQLKAQITDTTTFPLNEYLYTDGINPYPIVNDSLLKTIDTSKFINVMNFGAKGDGKILDDIAIKNAFNAANNGLVHGILFPSGKTFLVSKVTNITLTNDITIYAYGATIKMKDLTRYSFLSLQYQSGSYHNKVLWLGGTFDGNQYNQVWPGNPHGGNYNGAFVENHGRFVGVIWAEFVLFKDVNVLNTVVDGPTAESCKLAVFANSKASGGAPIWYDKVQEQGTYFKVTKVGMKTAYFLNLDCSGGSIATHMSYPTASAMDYQTLSVHVNCKIWNQAQDAIHIEDCYKNFFYNCIIGCDANGGFYQERVHISNRTGIVAVNKSSFTNSYLNFNQATSLKLGIVDSCTFTTTKSNYLQNFINGRPHLITHSSFTGTCLSQQANMLNTRECTFTDFGNYAVVGTTAVDSCTFINGVTPVSTSKSGFVVRSIFQQVKNTSYKTAPSNSDWKKVFSSYIDVYDDRKKYLGRISCGSDIITNTQTQVASTTANAFSSIDAKRHSGSITYSFDSMRHQSVPGTSAEALSNNNKISLQSQITKLYPNPTVDVLHVSLSEEVWGKTVLNIYDQQGRLMQSKTVDKNSAVLSETINVSSLTAGSYILQIINEHEKTALKFIVAR